MRLWQHSLGEVLKEEEELWSEKKEIVKKSSATPNTFHNLKTDGAEKADHQSTVNHIREESFWLAHPCVRCQGPAGTALLHLLQSPGPLPNLSIFVQGSNPARTIWYPPWWATHLVSDRSFLSRWLINRFSSCHKQTSGGEPVCLVVQQANFFFSSINKIKINPACFQ